MMFLAKKLHGKLHNKWLCGEIPKAEVSYHLNKKVSELEAAYTISELQMKWVS